MRLLAFVFFLVFTGFQCSTPLEFDGSERHRLSGRVLNDKGVPIANMLYTLVASGGGEDPFFDATLYSGLTDSQGKLSIIVSNTNASIYALYVNRPNVDTYVVDYKHVNPTLSSSVIKIDKNKLNDFEMNLGDITLVKGVELSINCEIMKNKRLDFISLNFSKTSFDHNDPFQNLDGIGYPCDKTDLKIMVPTNIKMYIFASGSFKYDSLVHYDYYSVKDSIQIFDSPLTYTII